MNDTHTAHYHPCWGGIHRVTWAGSPDYEIPNWYPCDCGQKMVYWQECPECEMKKMVFVDRRAK